MKRIMLAIAAMIFAASSVAAPTIEETVQFIMEKLADCGDFQYLDSTVNVKLNAPLSGRSAEISEKYAARDGWAEGWNSRERYHGYVNFREEHSRIWRFNFKDLDTNKAKYGTDENEAGYRRISFSCKDRADCVLLRVNEKYTWSSADGGISSYDLPKMAAKECMIPGLSATTETEHNGFVCKGQKKTRIFGFPVCDQDTGERIIRAFRHLEAVLEEEEELF